MNRSATARPFGIRDRVGYLFGDFGNDFTFIFSTMMLMKFYTSINIPYGSMASAISAEPDDRQSLSTFRTMGGTLAGVVIGVGLPLIAYQKVDGGETLIGPRVTLAAGVFSVLAVVCYLLGYTMVIERVQVPSRIPSSRCSRALYITAPLSPSLRLPSLCCWPSSPCRA